MNYLILVNKENHFDPQNVLNNLIEVATRIPGSVEVNRKILLEEETFKAWQEFKKEGLINGFDFDIDSGYRTYEYQQKILNYFIERKGLDEALLQVALPGTSDHHTGLALDYSFFRDGKYFYDVKETDDEYIWVKENAHKFGFIIRYPKGKEEITQYSFEPWHLRYVSVEHAKEINDKNLTLEEYVLTLETSKIKSFS